MDIGTVSVRYARALLMFATEQHEEDEVYNEMNTLCRVYLDYPQLRQMVENPSLSNSEKQNILCNAVGGKPCNTCQKFFALIVEKRRADIMQFVANTFVSLYLSSKHIIKSRLVVPTEINDAIANKMRSIVEAKTKNKVEMTVEVDPSINGGFILEYGTYRIDASINSQIKNIRKNLMRAAGNA